MQAVLGLDDAMVREASFLMAVGSRGINSTDSARGCSTVGRSWRE
jgi:hypothetical protein